MQRVRIQPIHWVGQAWHVFPRPDCQLEVATQPDEILARVEALHTDLQARLRCDVHLYPPVVVCDAAELGSVKQRIGEVDAVLVNASTGGVEAELFDWGIPVIAYSGECAPMMGLYNFPLAEREKHPQIVFALDAAEVDTQIRVIGAKKRLQRSRMVILGAYQCADKLPDPDVVKRKLGVDFSHVSGAEFGEAVEGIDSEAAARVAGEWQEGGLGGAEPSSEEVLRAARIYLAMEEILHRFEAQAISVGCLELMYLHANAPFCLALAALRDRGLPAGCEADAGATLTSLMLEYLADRPAYMGNLVHFDPAQNLLDISHGCSPARMAGRDQPAKPYRLVHSHSAPPFSRDSTGGSGVTSYVDYGDVGQEVTIARMSAGVDRIMAVRGEIVDCRDTICDRTTLTVRVADARRVVHSATGNHQVVIYGDFVPQLRALSQLLEMQLIEP